MDNQFDDISLLLDSLKYQADDARQQEQALKALATFLAQTGHPINKIRHWDTVSVFNKSDVFNTFLANINKST